MKELVTFSIILFLIKLIPNKILEIVGLIILLYLVFGNITPIFFILCGIILFIIIIKYIIDKSW